MGATNFSAFTYGTASVDPGSLADQNRGAVTITITGVAPGDLLILYPPSTLAAGLAYAGCEITAANTVRIDLYNASGGAIDDAATTWHYLWWDRTP